MKITTVFIFICCISRICYSQHYLTKINVSDKKNCYVTLIYKDGRQFSWKVLKKDTLKIVHSYQLDSICMKCDSVSIKYKMPRSEKNKTLRVPARGELRSDI